MVRRQWTIVWAITCVMVSCTRPDKSAPLPLHSIERWAEIFGQTIYAAASKATALTDLQTDYVLMLPMVEEVQGDQLLMQIRDDLERMLEKKVRAVKRLVEVAEESFCDYNEVRDINLTYPKAKNLSNFDIELVANPNFDSVEVNLSLSTVHVPTNVYDESSAVLNGVSWSTALDKVFEENYKQDPSLSWQYFGSSTGFFRNFPGMRWPKRDNEVDLYDCRTRNWYINAATSPKDLVILIDSSGSMTGLRREIAKATVEKIVETIGDDDYFNVIKFSEVPEYLEPCFNGSLIQGSVANKKRILDAMKSGMKTQNIANFEAALIEAFDILSYGNDSQYGSHCNKAVMLITDGAPDTYQAVFERYNWPNRDIRIFTYLIGREVGDPRNVRWMACSNKGYFSHISTMADVHEHVQEYIHVVSRPMVIYRANHTVWTTIYHDSSHSTQGVRLTTTVAQPVYDTKNSTTTSGNLLGVMGTDVPLSEMLKTMPHHKLGVNGYAFAITNNGQVLFHPRLRRTSEHDLQSNFRSVDLADLEFPDNQPDQDGNDVESDLSLRNEMIDGTTGSMRMSMRAHYDNKKRVAIRDRLYFYAPIRNTPFSLGVSLPDGYGTRRVVGSLALHEADLYSLKSSDIRIASWSYCRHGLDSAEGLTDVEQLLKILQNFKNLERNETDSEVQKMCDMELVGSLLFDAEATRGALANWMKENADGTLNHSVSKKNGIEIVFLGTRSGLTRYCTFVENLTDPLFIENRKETITSEYYSRAAEAGENVFTFSVPFAEDKKRLDVNSTVVTGSTAVFITVNGEDAMVAATGLQMKYNHFHELFLSAVTQCYSNLDPSCNLTCTDERLDCFLVDDNGYVVLSEKPEEHVGRFLGEIESVGSVMLDLIAASDEDHGIFKRVLVKDFQASCEVWRKNHSSSASFHFHNPIYQVLSVFWSIIREIALVLLEMNLFAWSSELNSSPGNVSSYFEMEYGDLEQEYPQQSNKTDYYIVDLDYLEVLSQNNSDLHKAWLNEWRKLMFLKRPPDVIKDWYRNLVEMYEPRVVDWRMCTKQYALYMAHDDRLPYHGNSSECLSSSNCYRPFSINRVPRTNLLLLVVDATCECNNKIKVSVQPKEVIYKEESPDCQRLRSNVYRRRPSHCFASHPEENSSKCGRSSRLEPAHASVLAWISICLLMRTRWHVVRTVCS